MTVIDELVLSLSLDPTKFVKGQKESVAALQKMEEQAKKSGGETETAATKMAEGFERVTKEVLGLGAAFLGVSGLKDLAVSSIRAASALQVQASAWDFNVEVINRWRNAARLAGLDANVAQSSIGQLGTTLAKLRTGQITPEGIGARALAALGFTGADYDPAHLEQFLLKLAAALQNPANRTPFIAQALTDEITGIGPLLPLLNQGPERVKGYLDEGQTITQAQTEAARRIEQAVSRLAFVLERIANKVFLSPESEHTAIEILGGARDIAQGNVIRGLKRINASVPGPAPPIETPLEPVTSQALWWVRHFPPTGRSNPVRGVDDVGFPGATRPQWFAPYLQLPVHPSVPSAAGFDRFGGDVNNSRTVHINAVHVTAPAGADPFEFGRQISAAVQAQMGSR